jgi:ankyrin repeat protein
MELTGMTLHEFLDWSYGADGDEALRRLLIEKPDLEERDGLFEETPLHIATRRHRASAVEILLDAGADIDAKTRGGKTAYAHAARRGFDEVSDRLRERGADTGLNAADRFAVAIVNGRFAEAGEVLVADPGAIRTVNPEEDRLLADVAGRNGTAAVTWLIERGADVAAPGLDSGTPLHQAAWFGQPDNARLLIDAGAPLDVFDSIHASSPVGWAVHGSRYSGGADVRQEAYASLTRMLIEAGSSLHYPDDPKGNAYFDRLLQDASPEVAEVLRSSVQ